MSRQRREKLEQFDDGTRRSIPDRASTRASTSNREAEFAEWPEIRCDAVLRRDIERVDVRAADDEVAGAQFLAMLGQRLGDVEDDFAEVIGIAPSQPVAHDGPILRDSGKPVRAQPRGLRQWRLRPE